MLKKILLGCLAVIVLFIAVALISTTKSKPKTSAAPNKYYVALGDSVAAGVGLENYSDSSACNRTNQAYPNLVAASLNLKLKNFACSGATLPVGIVGSQTVNQLALATQIDQLFKQPRPELISLTVGANDIQWTDIISKCYSGECGSASDSAAVNGLLATVTTNLQAALTQIQNHYKSDIPRVIVTGYHQVFPTSNATCSDLKGIDPAELAWGRLQQSNLNNTISTAVKPYAFARYAAVDFNGHELCSSDSWVQGLSDSAPYHPTDAGQAPFAKQVIATYKAFK